MFFFQIEINSVSISSIWSGWPRFIVCLHGFVWNLWSIIPSSWLFSKACSRSQRNSICLQRAKKQKKNIFEVLLMALSVPKSYLSSSNCCCELWNIATKPTVNMIIPKPIKNRLRPARAIRGADIFVCDTFWWWFQRNPADLFIESIYMGSFG